ncbi:MAG: response regulator [Chloroflexi bacterium]|nr:response regulator [Chloroflexota bacterium]
MANHRVLVVEDDRYGSEVVMRMLNHRNIDVDTVNSAEQALKLLQENAYSMVISDLALPGMDGWGLLRAIRADPKLAPLPVVAITAFHDAKLALEAQEAGFRAYFSKPLYVTFVDEIERILSTL